MVLRQKFFQFDQSHRMDISNVASALLDARQFLFTFFIKTQFWGVRKRKGIMQKNTHLQRNDHQSLQAMIIDRWQMFFFERRRIEKFCQKLIRNALPFGGKERRSLSGLLAYFIFYKVWSNCSVKSHHLFGTGFIIPVNENLKNRLYCDICFLLWHTA